MKCKALPATVIHNENGGFVVSNVCLPNTREVLFDSKEGADRILPKKVVSEKEGVPKEFPKSEEKMGRTQSVVASRV